RHGGEVKGGVLLALRPGAGLDPGVAEGDNEIALGPEFRNQPLCGQHDVARLELPFEVRLVPRHDLRRDEADDANAEFMSDARVILKGAIQNGVGREESAAAGSSDIGAEEGEWRALQ